MTTARSRQRVQQRTIRHTLRPSSSQSILDGGETMTVAQSGYDQGYQAVKTVVAHLNGEKVDSFVDCGTKVIDSTTAEDYMATLKSQMDGKAVAQ
jgi:ribose transport system substrate-binding protein